MTKNQALLYKQRWKRIGSVQDQELRKSSLTLKFKQLCWLMDSFYLVPDKKRELETGRVRQRWLLLKERWKNGRH